MGDNDNRLKILFIPGWYPSEDNPVAGVFIREHAKAVSMYDDVVVLYVSPPTRKNMSGFYTLTDQIEEGIRTIRAQCRRIPIPKLTYLLMLFVYWRIFRRLASEGFRPDILHAHVYFAGVPAVILSRLYRIPLVITEHDSAFPRKLLKRSRVAMARFAMKRASVVLPVSQYLQSHIESYGISARFQVIDNVVETELFRPDAGGEAFDASKDRKRLLTVALLTHVKGIPYLLEALHRLRKRRRDFELDIVGDGHDRGEFETLAARLDLDDVVRFHGLKSRYEVAEFMRRCDIFVLPSLVETFGVVVIEAMASGKPVVASDIGALRETVTKEVGCLAPPEDADALAYALDWMLDNYHCYQPQAIAEYAQQRYSYEAVGRKLHDVYMEVR